MISVNDFDFQVPADGGIEWKGLNYIAGMDVSFVERTMQAIGCLAILSFPDLKVIHEEFEEVTLTEPYIPGFLAFRECTVLISLLASVKDKRPEIYPQVLFIDGNGQLHPRLFGSACHVGVLANLPSIGIGKNFLAIEEDGLMMHEVKAKSKVHLPNENSWFPLIGTSGTVYGAATEYRLKRPSV
ncbi:hypothetical protein HDU97_006898 [Phlyctochytrium planicorne]|nr:hypothetical protein HDU97_006898 [Phlyctochytrium planicorne]